MVPNVNGDFEDAVRMQNKKNVKVWIALWNAVLIGLLVGSNLTGTKEFKIYNTIEERRATEQEQELQDRIESEVKEALKGLPLLCFY
jgi:hypothetical protein